MPYVKETAKLTKILAKLGYDKTHITTTGRPFAMFLDEDTGNYNYLSCEDSFKYLKEIDVPAGLDLIISDINSCTYLTDDVMLFKGNTTFTRIGYTKSAEVPVIKELSSIVENSQRISHLTKECPLDIAMQLVENKSDLMPKHKELFLSILYTADKHSLTMRNVGYQNCGNYAESTVLINPFMREI